MLLAIAAGGFAGALARYWLGGVVARRRPSAWPTGTFFVNISGALLLGLLTGLTSGQTLIPEALQVGLAAGFLGAYTTFSTFQLEGLRLSMTGQGAHAAAYLLGSVLVGLLAAGLGLWLGLTLA